MSTKLNAGQKGRTQVPIDVFRIALLSVLSKTRGVRQVICVSMFGKGSLRVLGRRRSRRVPVRKKSALEKASSSAAVRMPCQTSSASGFHHYYYYYCRTGRNISCRSKCDTYDTTYVRVAKLVSSHARCCRKSSRCLQLLISDPCLFLPIRSTYICLTGSSATAGRGRADACFDREAEYFGPKTRLDCRDSSTEKLLSYLMSIRWNTIRLR